MMLYENSFRGIFIWRDELINNINLLIYYIIISIGNFRCYFFLLNKLNLKYEMILSLCNIKWV